MFHSKSQKSKSKLKMENKVVDFNPEVSRAVFDKERRTDGCIENIPSTTLVEENEIANRCSEFQSQNRFQKRELHEHHIQRKRCRLVRRQDIIDALWNVYEQEAFNRLNELINDSSVVNEPIQRYAFDAILSVDKIEIIKLWREKCMFLFPQVEQHQMVPFHDRWIQSQFKEEKNIEKMQERLSVRAKASTHWLSELVDELTVSPEAQPSQDCSSEKEPKALNELESTDSQIQHEFNFELVTEALNDLESAHPEIFEELQFLEELRPDEQTSFPNTTVSEEFDTFATDEDSTDNTLIQAMEEWEEKQIEHAMETWDYTYLLDDEVSK